MRNHKSGKGEPKNCEGVQSSTCIAVVFLLSFFIVGRFVWTTQLFAQSVYKNLQGRNSFMRHTLNERNQPKHKSLATLRWTRMPDNRMNEKNANFYQTGCHVFETSLHTIAIIISHHSAHSTSCKLYRCVVVCFCVWVCTMELHDAYVITTSYPSTIYLEHHIALLNLHENKWSTWHVFRQWQCASCRKTKFDLRMSLQRKPDNAQTQRQRDRNRKMNKWNDYAIKYMDHACSMLIIRHNIVLCWMHILLFIMSGHTTTPTMIVHEWMMEWNRNKRNPFTTILNPNMYMHSDTQPTGDDTIVAKKTPTNTQS